MRVTVLNPSGRKKRYKPKKKTVKNNKSLKILSLNKKFLTKLHKYVNLAIDKKQNLELSRTDLLALHKLINKIL